MSEDTASNPFYVPLAQDDECVAVGPFFYEELALAFLAGLDYAAGERVPSCLWPDDAGDSRLCRRATLPTGCRTDSPDLGFRRQEADA